MRAIILTGRSPLEMNGGDIRRLETLVYFLPRSYTINVVVTRPRSANHHPTKIILKGRGVNIEHLNNPKWAQCIGLVKSILTFKPLQCGLFMNFFVERQLSKYIICHNFDLMIVHLARNLSWNEIAEVETTILDMCDYQSANYWKSFLSKNSTVWWRLVSLYEYFTFTLYEKCITQAQLDKIIFINKNDANLFVDKNGSDASNALSAPNAMVSPKNLGVTNFNDRNLVIVGNFSSKHNISMVNALIKCRTLEKLAAVNLGIKLVGMMSVEQAKIWKKYGFSIWENVDDVNDHISNCVGGICIPEFSSGFQTKVVDYVIAGLPLYLSRDVIDGGGFTAGYDCVLVPDISALPDLLLEENVAGVYVTNSFKTLCQIEGSAEKLWMNIYNEN